MAPTKTTTTKAPTKTTTTKAPTKTTTTKATTKTTTTKAPTKTTTTKAPTKTTATKAPTKPTTTSTQESTTVKVSKSVDSFIKAPRPPCTSVPVNKAADVGQLLRYMKFLSGGSTRRSASGPTKITTLKFGKTADNKDLQLYRVRPYYVKNIRNAVYVPKRPAIWIEAGI